MIQENTNQYQTVIGRSVEDKKASLGVGSSDYHVCGDALSITLEVYAMKENVKII